jgi:adenine phosphoribosyltransferase
VNEDRQQLSDLIGSLVRDIPDFPKPDVTFKDITPLLDDWAAFTAVVGALAAAGRDEDGNVVVDKVVGMEARGFILAAPVALALGVGFVPVRKPGKLPYQKIRQSYDLEYGTDAVEMHDDSVQPGEHVLIVDDLVATGGTALAAARMVESLGGIVAGFGFIVELTFLPGREKLKGYEVESLIQY